MNIKNLNFKNAKNCYRQKNMCKNLSKTICIALLVTFVVQLFSPLSAAYAATEKVDVSIPDFDVMLNGEKMDTVYNKYPLIIYNSITYFPMTYVDSRFLGLETEWLGNEDGLFIEKTSTTVAYDAEKTEKMNQGIYTAQIPDFPLTVNGISVDNSKEEYPILTFRDITYFPLTWKWAVESFGWEYSFNKETGLDISSTNPKVISYDIDDKRPALAAHEVASNEQHVDKLSRNVVVTDEFVYYVGAEGEIYETSLSDTSQKRLIHKIDEELFNSTSGIEIKLFMQEGDVRLSLQTLGGIMNLNTYTEYKINGELEVLKEITNYTDIKYGDKTIGIDPTDNLYPGNVFIIDEEGHRENIGFDTLYHGVTSDKMMIYEEDLYLYAHDVTDTLDDNNSMLYKIDLVTGEKEYVDDSRDFYIEDGKLYSAYDYVIVTDLNTGEHLSTVTPIVAPYGYSSQVKVLNGIVYVMKATVKAAQSLPPYEEPVYQFWSSKEYEMLDGQSDVSNIETFEMLEQDDPEDFDIMGTTEKYMVLTFKDTPFNDYRLAILDDEGNVVFKTSDRVYLDNVNIVGDMLYYYNFTTETVCVTEL